MNNRFLRRIAVLLVAPFAAAIACGGRTGDFLPGDPDSGAATGSGGASNGKSGGKSVGTGNAPPVGRPPVGSGGTIGRPPPPPPASGGKATFGGAAGSFAAGGAPGIVCSPPACNCPDCLSSCSCMLGGQVTQFCIDQCQGSIGTGGAPPVFCGRPGQPERLCTAGANFTFPSCCTSSFECGAELVPPNQSMSYPFATGCQPMNQPGRFEPGCPDLAALFMGGAGAPAGIQGCCRPDGTCGIDASAINLGCVQSLIRGRSIQCPQSEAGPVPPVDAGVD